MFCFFSVLELWINLDCLGICCVFCSGNTSLWGMFGLVFFRGV